MFWKISRRPGAPRCTFRESPFYIIKTDVKMSHSEVLIQNKHIISTYQTNLTCTGMWTQQMHHLLHVSALTGCHHHGVLISAKVVSFKLVHIMRHSHSLTKSFTRTHIRDQFEGHNSNRYKNSLMMALKSRRSCVYCVHIPVYVRLVW